jgi:hypothetical protein
MDRDPADVRALLTARADQNQSELTNLAGLLGVYRASLMEAGFSREETFTLIQRLYMRAILTVEGPLLSAPPPDWGEDDE